MERRLGITDRLRRRGAEIITTGGATYDYPQDFEKTVVDLANESYAFVIVANHMSHADALFAAKVGYNLALILKEKVSDDKKIKGFVMPFAASIRNNGQGQTLGSLYEAVIPYLEKLGTEPAYTPTSNDVRGENPRIKPEDSTEIRRRYAREMIRAVKDGKAIIVFPEGKVEGGRRDEYGNRKGLQEFEKEALSFALRISTAGRDKVAVIPAGISGGYNVWDPQRRKLSMDARLVGLGFRSKNLVSVNVGNPILFDKQTIQQISSESLDSIVGIAIAKLLPEQERGIFYREAKL